MKIKSKISAHKNPIITLEVEDQYDPKSILTEKKIYIKNESHEEIVSNQLHTSGMIIVDAQMHFDTPQVLEFEIEKESIVMNFILCNNVETHIEQFESEKFSTENTHNILYANNFNGTFQIPAFEPVNYLSFILSLDFYLQLINKNWKLHQKFSKNILAKKSTYFSTHYIPFSSGVQWIIHEIKNCTLQEDLKRMYIETKIKELLILQLEALTHKPTPIEQIDEEDLKKLQEAKVILDVNYAKSPSLPELSRMISLNEFKLKKGFKACFNTTVKSYVIKLRMEHAKELFKNKAATVSEVAYKCGYKDVSHFSAAFKSFYGFSPQKFKMNWESV
ncbi:helix-turn-helix domain-containing protein [Flavobacterium hercynium]|uniref:DNA-binding protein n=1 Tax=Flavobacterium hercynium TaxID=387094 RepID=A0A226H8U6_9FLAO|nr:AraC family transcriptional regulator [Flavobacterium hercynium]OXA90494.1 DNA-binding protein [Flavobacterium hercynium]SMP28738.1 transcriptional regulator, AraC family [Flavobacterium hercynium]